MSYSSRTRYTSRREKRKKINKNMRIAIVAILIVLVVILLKNRVSLYDYYSTYFY